MFLERLAQVLDIIPAFVVLVAFWYWKVRIFYK